MISTVGWVPKGVSKPTLSAEPTEAELLASRAQMRDDGGDDADDVDDAMTSDEDTDSEDEEEEANAQDAVAKARKAAAAFKSEKLFGASSGTGRGGGDRESGAATETLDLAMKELDMDNYDDEPETGVGGLMMRMLGGRNHAAVDEDGDPYITLGDAGSESDAEAEDFDIKDTDLIILAARNEDDVSNLEVWVYEEAEEEGEEANIFVHHDVMLPSFPLALAWMDCDPKGLRDRCNMLAVSTLEPGIEIWDLDVVDAVEPVAVLGGEDKDASEAALDAAARAANADDDDAGTSKNSKKKKKKKGAATLMKKSVIPGSHSDSVLGLSWNREYRNVLASGSADHTVKVWDVSRQACEHTLTHHKGKVQAVAWNPVESPVLLTGSYDKTACLVDVRTPTGTPVVWKVSADVEALTWHPHDPTCFLVSAEDGLVACIDARKGAGSAPLYRLAAHDAPTCSLSFCPGAPGLLATCSTDKKVKLWDVQSGAPSMVASQDLSLGAVFSVSFCPEAPNLLAVGGAQGGVTIWDLGIVGAVTSRWPELKRRRRRAPKEV